MKSCYSRLWKLDIPPKIKMFWWRAIHNGIPVAANLKRRGIKVDTVCQICGDAEKNYIPPSIPIQGLKGNLVFSAIFISKSSKRSV